MTKLLAYSAGVLMIALGGPALAQAGSEAKPAVACEVMGHDLILYNRSEGPLAAGTTIQWSAWLGKRKGEQTLEEPLVPFVGLRLSGALGASYLWDRPCEASVSTPASTQ